MPQMKNYHISLLVVQEIQLVLVNLACMANFANISWVLVPLGSASNGWRRTIASEI
jgi:hypothetical protein